MFDNICDTTLGGLPGLSGLVRKVRNVTIRGRSVTIADVAAAAAVSVGTASKALNGRGTLRPETRGRVQDVADRLGYQPSSLARSLYTGRSYTVGMITSDRIGRFSIPVMIGAEDALGAGEMSVYFCDAREDPIREQHHVRTLLSRGVDGIIVTGRRTEAREPLTGKLPVPVVYVYMSSANPEDCSVVADQVGGAQRAIEHLLSTGRQRIAHVTGPEHHDSARVRADSALRTLADNGLSLVTPPLFGEWSEQWGRQAVGILSQGAPFDAVFCGSDQVARGVATALQSAGRRVPDDVAIVGFDNWDVMVNGSQPPLTSIDQDLEGLGRAAAGMLLDAIDGRPAPGVHHRPCRLVVRESTAADLTRPAAAGG